MQNILIDAGPIIALFDKDDTYHQQVTQFISEGAYQFISTWPVITEASHMLSFSSAAQQDLLKWMLSGGVQTYQIEYADMQRIIELTQKYSDIPMDLADASLVITSEKRGVKQIISIDSDFYIYRTIYKEMIENILQL